MNRKRQRSGPVVIECQLCKWSTTASTWRPAKRAARVHRDKKHAASSR